MKLLYQSLEVRIQIYKDIEMNCWNLLINWVLQIEFIGKKNLSDFELRECYSEADVFMGFSEHEGFCVPLIESQSMGIPVVSARVSAIEETLGSDQLLEKYPVRKADYLFYAKVLNEVMINSDLAERVVEGGYRNFRQRFNLETLSDSFAGIIAKALMQN